MMKGYALCVLAVAIALTVDVPVKDLAQSAVVTEQSLGASSTDAIKIESECQRAAAKESAIQRASVGSRTPRNEIFDECVAVKAAEQLED